jgi:hypothetical protein
MIAAAAPIHFVVVINEDEQGRTWIVLRRQRCRDRAPRLARRNT